MSALRIEQRRLQDRVRPGIKVLFVGINPGFRSAEIGHHFAGYSNRFWKLLYDSGLVPEPITCLDDGRLPEWGYGLTNLVARPTHGMDELGRHEYDAGRQILERKIGRLKPTIVALVGITLYHRLFRPSQTYRANPAPGLQQEALAGVPLFLLPNPSGRNANFRYEEMLDAFRDLKRQLERVTPDHR